MDGLIALITLIFGGAALYYILGAAFTGGKRQCPYCGATISRSARKCMYCKSNLRQTSDERVGGSLGKLFFYLIVIGVVIALVKGYL